MYVYAIITYSIIRLVCNIEDGPKGPRQKRSVPTEKNKKQNYVYTL